MKHRGFDRFALLTTLICLMPMLLGIYVYPALPDQVAIHFNAAGQPNGYASKVVAAFGLPLFLAAINAVCHVALNSDPKRAGVSGVLSTVAKCIAPVISLIINPIMLLTALRDDYYIMGDLALYIIMLMGLLFAVFGNYLPKCRQNYTVGIKLPWTLSDEDNWNKTHRFAGYVWIICGVSLVGGSFVLRSHISWLVGIVALMALLPVGYSFWLHARAH